VAPAFSSAAGLHSSSSRPAATAACLRYPRQRQRSAPRYRILAKWIEEMPRCARNASIETVSTSISRSEAEKPQSTVIAVSRRDEQRCSSTAIAEA